MELPPKDQVDENSLPWSSTLTQPRSTGHIGGIQEFVEPTSPRNITESLTNGIRNDVQEDSLDNVTKNRSTLIDDTIVNNDHIDLSESRINALFIDVTLIQNLLRQTIANYLNETPFGVKSLWSHGNLGKIRAYKCLYLLSSPYLQIYYQSDVSRQKTVILKNLLLIWCLLHTDASQLCSQLVTTILSHDRFKTEYGLVKDQFRLYEQDVIGVKSLLWMLRERLRHVSMITASNLRYDHGITNLIEYLNNNTAQYTDRYITNFEFV